MNDDPRSPCTSNQLSIESDLLPNRHRDGAGSCAQVVHGYDRHAIRIVGRSSSPWHRPSIKMLICLGDLILIGPSRDGWRLGVGHSKRVGAFTHVSGRVCVLVADLVGLGMSTCAEV